MSSSAPCSARKRVLAWPFAGIDRWGSVRASWRAALIGRTTNPGTRVLRLGVPLVFVFLGACSSGDGSASTTETSAATTTPPSATTTQPSTTALDPTTTDPPTTVATTTSTTTLSTATAPPPTPEEEVRAALDQGFADFSACLTSMPNCDPTVLADTRAGDLLATNVARIEEWNEAGYTVIDRDQFRFVIETVDLSDDGTAATATVCLADGSKLVAPAAGPDGADVIIDDVFISAREAWAMRLDADGSWRAYSAPVVGSTEETDVCPSAS